MAISITVDLRQRFGLARDQGVRPTCLAFAASDAHAALKPAPWAELSCEYAFCCAQRRAGLPPTSGATLRAMREAMLHDGQPLETAWPYLDQLPDDLSHYRPPKGVALFNCDGDEVNATVDNVVAELAAGRLPLIGMSISDAFLSPDPNGVVGVGATEKPDLTRLHAVIAVGWGTIDAERAVLVRNSWGRFWAASGYGWLIESYLRPRLMWVVLLKERANVS